MKSKPRIALVDYEMGNLRSVGKALESSGARVEWARSPSDFKRADAVVLPGVGAFQVAMRNLRKRKLVEPLQNWISKQKPFLGICLGYQLLFDESSEGGRSRGLGIFKGTVRKFSGSKSLKVPHMGWNQIELESDQNSYLEGIENFSYLYFVHSYFPVPKDTKIISTRTRYGENFASSVSAKNLFASQFHPEKSGETGLKILGNFIKTVH